MDQGFWRALQPTRLPQYNACVTIKACIVVKGIVIIGRSKGKELSN